MEELILLVDDEHLNNIVIHGLQGKCDPVVVELSMDEAVRIRFFDRGVAWEPPTVSRRAAEFVIVEGLFVLHRQELMDKAIAKIFVNCDEFVRIGRRVKRDMTERGRTESEIMERYVNITEPMHREIVEPTMANTDLIVCGCGDPDVALMTVQDFLQGKPHFRKQLAHRATPLQCWL